MILLFCVTIYHSLGGMQDASSSHPWVGHWRVFSPRQFPHAAVYLLLRERSLFAHDNIWFLSEPRREGPIHRPRYASMSVCMSASMSASGCHTYTKNPLMIGSASDSILVWNQCLVRATPYTHTHTHTRTRTHTRTHAHTPHTHTHTQYIPTIHTHTTHLQYPSLRIIFWTPEGKVIWFNFETVLSMTFFLRVIIFWYAFLNCFTEPYIKQFHSHGCPHKFYLFCPTLLSSTLRYILFNSVVSIPIDPCL